VARRKSVHPWIEKLARLGYATKGVVYVLIGVLAGATALQARHASTDAEGAFIAVLSQPFGGLLIAGVGIGLIAYSAWRFAQGWFDAEGKGADGRGIGARLSYAASGLIHAGLAWSALKLAVGLPRESANANRDATAKLLNLPLGPWLVAAVGAGVFTFGLYQLYKGYTKKPCERLDGRKMSAREEGLACRSAQFGLAARGVVLCLIGWFFLTAAWTHDPAEAGGLAKALRTLESQPYGPALLGAVALGLAAYGLYMFVECRYHRIRAE
jgi:hypothetical protein